MSERDSSRPSGMRRAFALPASARRAARDVEAEFAFHLQERVDELVERGMSRAEAEAEVRRRFGDVEAWRRETAAIDARAARRAGGGLLGGSWRDLRLALRGMARRPGLTSAIVLTLALAIGASTTIYSAVNSVLLRPIPVPWLDELHVVQLDLHELNLLDAPVSPVTVEELIARTDLFATGTGYTGTTLTLTGDGEPRRLRATRTVGDFFGVFGGRALLGTTYRPEQSEEGSHLVAVLSYATWRDVMGGDPSVIGRTVELSGNRYEVIGVMPPEFRFPRTTELWVPQMMNADARTPVARGRLFMTPVMRVKPGVTTAQLEAGLAAEARRWAGDAPGSEDALRLHAQPLVHYMSGNLRPVLLILLGAVGFVLLIASANVASLQLVRAIGRAKELAVRAALGAGRGAIARQLLVESLALAVLGGVLGIGVALVLLKLLSVWAVGQYELLRDVRLDLRVLGVTAATTIGVGLLFGLAPTLRAARTNLNDALKEATRGSSGGPARNRLLQGAVVVQVALTLVLLLGAGTLTRSLGRLVALDPGFRPEQAYAMSVAIAGDRYATPDARVAFFDALLERVRAIPGIEAASVVSGLPFSGSLDSSPFTLPDVPERPGEPERHANLAVVGDDYFRTLGIPLVAGRDFATTDRVNTPLVAIVDERLARAFFGNEDPIGRTISQGMDATIVGVVRTVKQHRLDEPDKATVYYSNRQHHWIRSFHVVVRTAQPLGMVVPQVQRAVRELDPNVPVYEPRALGELVTRSVATERLAMAVMLGFATLSLVLAILGVYGVISYAVSQRVPELGIRLALGATPAGVAGLVMRGGLMLVAGGALVGALVFLGVGDTLAGVLYEVSPRDPAMLTAGVLALLLTAAAACWLPARRAARVPPVEALRGEG